MSVYDDRWTCPHCGLTVLADDLSVRERRVYLSEKQREHRCAEDERQK